MFWLRVKQYNLQGLASGGLKEIPIFRYLLERLVGFIERYKKFKEDIDGEDYSLLTAQEKDRREKMHLRKVLHDCLKKLMFSAVSAPNFEQALLQIKRIKKWYDAKYLALEESGSDFHLNQMADDDEEDDPRKKGQKKSGRGSGHANGKRSSNS